MIFMILMILNFLFIIQGMIEAVIVRGSEEQQPAEAGAHCDEERGPPAGHHREPAQWKPIPPGAHVVLQGDFYT